MLRHDALVGIEFIIGVLLPFCWQVICKSRGHKVIEHGTELLLVAEHIHREFDPVLGHESFFLVAGPMTNVQPFLFCAEKHRLN